MVTCLTQVRLIINPAVLPLEEMSGESTERRQEGGLDGQTRLRSQTLPVRNCGVPGKFLSLSEPHSS